AGAHPPAVDDLVALDHAHAKARQVVFAGGVEAGKLRGLAADESAAREPAALGDPRHDLGRLLGAELARGVVVEEKERLGPGAGHVVGAHGHQVLTDGVVTAGEEGDLELGPYPVRAGDEDRVAVAARQRHQAGESSHTREDFLAPGGAGEGRDLLDQALALLDVDATIT